MIAIEQALALVSDVKGPFGEESVRLDAALGRVLCRAVVSPIDSPPFDKSAMDGFAVRRDESATLLRVVETVAAGNVAARSIAGGECSRIMTGAMLPNGAGRVIRKELVEEQGQTIRIREPETGDNVVKKGASLKTGDLVLAPRLLRPQDIGILAASGVAEIPVAKPPRVGVLTTGSEIKNAGESLAPGQIYDSNGPQLVAGLRSRGVPGEHLGVIPDEGEETKAAIDAALRDWDILILTGGVSAGDFDYVPRCLAELGLDIVFHGVAMKPGKPTLLARRQRQFVFGLPGNPVSTFVTFELFVVPVIMGWMGLSHAPLMLAGTLCEALEHRPGDRDEFVPVRYERGSVMALRYHGSAHLNALSEANALLRIDARAGRIEKGAQVVVRSL